MDHKELSEDTAKESHEDWVAGALVFAQALSTIIKDGEGVLIKATGEAEDYFGPKDSLLIVANAGGQMQIMPLNEVLEDTSGFEEGMWITISAPGEEDNDELNFEMDAE
jgi:hypothetical protein